MIDADTFLTVLYITVDDFCKSNLPAERRPGPEASLSRSEVVTLVMFGQWGRFQSEREFYRFAEQRLRGVFPTLPKRSQCNRLVRTHHVRGFAAKVGLHNFCLWLNRRLGRKPLEFADLLGW